MKTDKSPLLFMGGKHYIRHWIAQKLDYSCKCYIELFGGGASVLFAKPPHKVEIYNDKDELLVNFFKVLRDHPDELKRRLQLIPYSRKIYNELQQEFKETGFKDLNPIEKAVKFFYLNRCSFHGGLVTGWSYGFTRNHARSYFNIVDNLEAFSKRIRNVMIECRDFREILNAIKRRHEEEIMIYADPPYVGVEHYYRVKFTEKDHIDLAKILNKLKCKIAISYYPNELIFDLYPEDKWFYFTKEVVKHSQGLVVYNKGQKHRARTTELLILNYKPKNLNF